MLFDPLRAESSVLQVRRRTFAARRRHHDRVVAIVAACSPANCPFTSVDFARAMDGKRYAAIGTLEGITALPAEHSCRVTEPTEKDERLIAARKAFTNGRSQIAADNDLWAPLCVFGSHVDEAHLRKRTVEDAPLEGDPGVLA